MSDNTETKNTDRELWRGPDEGNGDYYADSVHVTAGGGIGINCGGRVIVMTPQRWQEAATENGSLRSRIAELEAALRPLAERADDVDDHDGGNIPDNYGVSVRVGDLRRALAVLPVKEDQ